MTCFLFGKTIVMTCDIVLSEYTEKGKKSIADMCLTFRSVLSFLIVYCKFHRISEEIPRMNVTIRGMFVFLFNFAIAQQSRGGGSVVDVH